jgi:predicted transcriptional regulator
MIRNIKEYMKDLGWDIIDLHQQTDIDIADLQDILKSKTKPSYSQVMLIVVAITKQYPTEQNWQIYHNIMVSPIFRGGDK